VPQSNRIGLLSQACDDTRVHSQIGGKHGLPGEASGEAFRFLVKLLRCFRIVELQGDPRLIA
jgi:hypothetical protein